MVSHARRMLSLSQTFGQSTPCPYSNHKGDTIMNAVTWFEIPATDFDRAVRFYEGLLGITLERMLFGGTEPNGIFPSENGVGGAVAFVPYAKPSDEGAVIYLNARTSEVLDRALAQVEGLGGAVVMPKTDIGPMGKFALIRDTEGNRVGLHIAAGA